MTERPQILQNHPPKRLPLDLVITPARPIPSPPRAGSPYTGLSGRLDHMGSLQRASPPECFLHLHPSGPSRLPDQHQEVTLGTMPKSYLAWDPMVLERRTLERNPITGGPHTYLLAQSSALPHLHQKGMGNSTRQTCLLGSDPQASTGSSLDLISSTKPPTET